MENEEYLRSIGTTDEQVVTRCLAAMEKYGENHWWEPDVDPRKMAYYQAQEDLLLVGIRHFHESVKLLLGRPVYMHEFAPANAEKILQEVERAWKYQTGVMSHAESQERIAEAVKDLENIAGPENIIFIDSDDAL